MKDEIQEYFPDFGALPSYACAVRHARSMPAFKVFMSGHGEGLRVICYTSNKLTSLFYLVNFDMVYYYGIKSNKAQLNQSR
jgi:hypothetical protein